MWIETDKKSPRIRPLTLASANAVAGGPGGGLWPAALVKAVKCPLR